MNLAYGPMSRICTPTKLTLLKEKWEDVTDQIHLRALNSQDAMLITLQQFLGSSVIITMTRMIPLPHSAIVCFGITVSDAAGPLHSHTKEKDSGKSRLLALYPGSDLLDA